MPKKYDAGLKVLLDMYLPDWLTLVPRRPQGSVHIIDADIATITAAADKVLFIADPTPWILHVELQADRDPSLEWRVPLYNAVLEYKHRCSVHSLVVLVTKRAETPGLTGEWLRQFDGESPYRYLRYQVVRVWEFQADQLARGPWGMFPLAPLCEDAEKLMPGLIRTMGERVLADRSHENEGKDIWMLTQLLLGLRYREPLLDLLLKEMKNMIDLKKSLSYEKMFGTATAEGRAQGKTEGKIESLRETILHLGGKKFGKPSAKIVREIRAVADERRLTELSERILDVSSWQQLLAPKGSK